VLQGSSDDADDLVDRALTRWLQRGLSWKEEAGTPTVSAVVGYLKRAVMNAYLDRRKHRAATHEAPPVEEELPLNEELKLLREHLDHLVTSLRPFLKNDPLADLYVDLLLAGGEVPSDEEAARALGDDISVRDIRNMKKRLDRHVRDMYVAMQAN
jgi:DNA-directed RNA polymerase specialized sigma24 family protein